MRNFHIGTAMGIPIRVNVSLVVFLPVLAYLIASGGQIATYVDLIAAVSPQQLDAATLRQGAMPWIIGTAGAVGLFGSVLLHELGHSWMARRYGVEITSITLWIFGGMAHMRKLPEQWDREFWIALAGPAVSLALGVGGVALLQGLPAGAPVVTFVVGYLGVVNLALVAFNLLPAFPMDGGRVLRALLARRGSYVDATRTAATVGKGMAVLLAVVGVLGNPILILIALFVYMAASSEAKATVVRELLRGVVVSDMMATEVPTVDPDTTVDALVERIMRDRVAGFPVVDDGQLVGVVGMDDLRDVAPGDRDTTTVRDVMTADPPTVAPGDDAFRALQTFGEHGGPLVVASDGQFVGVVTQADFVRTMEAIQGLGEPERPDLTPDGYA